jgi:hypothetical protein
VDCKGGGAYLDIQLTPRSKPTAAPVALPRNQADIRAYLPTTSGARNNLSEGVHEVPAVQTGQIGA